jgi:hypothetical protein
MKLIKSKFKVLTAPQVGRTNIAAAKMESWLIIDHNTSYANIRYFELKENKAGKIGNPLYTPVRLPVTGSKRDDPSLKAVLIDGPTATAIWAAIRGEVPTNADLLTALSDQFTTATVVQLAHDKNFVKISNGDYTPLEIQDWEIVNDEDLITQEDLDRWEAEKNA